MQMRQPNEAQYQALQSSEDLNEAQYQALQTLYASTKGIFWTWQDMGGRPWRFDIYENPCDPDNIWEGLTCDESGTSIIQISLPKHNITGSLPPDVFTSLTSLLQIKLNNNSLTGTIPSSLRHLTS